MATEAPLTILLRGSFKLDNNNSMAETGLASTELAPDLPLYNIRYISRLQPNYLPARIHRGERGVEEAQKRGETPKRNSPAGMEYKLHTISPFEKKRVPISLHFDPNTPAREKGMVVYRYER